MNRRGFVSRAVDYVAGFAGGIAALGVRGAAASEAVKPDGIIVTRVNVIAVERDPLGVTNAALDWLLDQVPDDWKQGDWKKRHVFCIHPGWVLRVQEARHETGGSVNWPDWKHRGIAVQGCGGIERGSPAHMAEESQHFFAVLGHKEYPMDFAGPPSGAHSQLADLRRNIYRLQRELRELKKPPPNDNWRLENGHGP